MNDDWLIMLTETQKQIKALHQQYPDDPALLSALRQVDYLLALETRTETDDSMLEKINIGYLAVYPLSDVISKDLSEALCEISERIRRDLRRKGRRMEFE